MSRKSSSKGTGAKLRRAAAGAVRKKAGSEVRKNARKVFRKIPLKILIPAAAAVFGILAGVTFVPEERVPRALEKPHTALLTARNKLIRMSGLPISRYDDTFILPNDGSAPIRLYFAPSPKICPAVCAFIRSAVRSVDVCAFDIKLDTVADALIDAKARGIDVRVVTDTDYLKNPALCRLSRAGIPIVSDRKSSLMHNKFIVADSRFVWTGSYNLTDNGTERNDNNALLIESPSIAKGYEERFKQYWNGKFSTEGKRSAPQTNVFIGRIPAQYAFSPTDKVCDILMHELSGAKHTVDVMAFSFTGAELAGKLRELVKRGVRVRCLFDYGQSKNKASRDGYLRKIGAQVYYSPNRTGKMHHKVFIIDEKTVITGSYNFSRNAEKRNDENILLIRSPRLAELYTREMDRCIKGVKGY